MKAPVLITGAAKRLGFALAKDLLEKDRPVICTYRTPQEGIEELYDKGAVIYQCDFYEADQLDKLVSELQDNHPSLSGIVHNASDWMAEASNINAGLMDKGDMNRDILNKMLQIHVTAPYLLNIALKDSLVKGAAPTSNIIHISDYVASTGSQKHIAYAASKAAMENMGLSFAKAYAPLIKVNSIAPALMLFNDHDQEDYKRKALNKSLMGKEGGIDSFLQAVHYLLDNDYVTGQTLHLNGGRHLK